ncbi:PAS domain-containing protein [Fundidesulfovibrio soli]|uniref:PAS domain-containing protein n=1 Tax=Fundidesulfovibrio soli TaxID=2922716 RepID=UPI001FAEC2BA|nr:PAS domain-containing protein [Fundidesulfovibrio soli]
MDEPQTPTREELEAENERLRQALKQLEAAEAVRKRAHARLQAECEAFRSVFDESPVMQIWFDREGRVLRVNKAAMAAASLDQPPQDFSVFTDPQLIMLGVPGYFRQALAGTTVRMPRYVFNAHRTHGPAQDLDMVLETVLYPVFGADGAVDSVVVQHFDVTELARAQEAARSAGAPPESGGAQG